MSTLLAFLPGIGPPELLVVGFIALLLFGKKLPEVARSLGKGVTEFKKGVQGIQDEIDETTNRHELPYSNDVATPQAPKFEPPAEVPVEAPAVSEVVARNEPGTQPD